MSVFTKQERAVLTLLLFIALSGITLQYVFKRYSLLKDIVNLIDSDRIYSKVDINTATFEELVDLPYIGEFTASNIIQYRQQHGPFVSHQHLKKVKGIRDKNYEKFLPYLKPL